MLRAGGSDFGVRNGEAKRLGCRYEECGGGRSATGRECSPLIEFASSLRFSQ
jgi:hypothetical protein